MPLSVDLGWARYTLAHLYRNLGRREDALWELRAVVNDHAKCNHRLHLEKLLADDAPKAWIDTAMKTLAAYEGGPEDWIQRRTEAARAEIAELESTESSVDGSRSTKRFRHE